MLIEILLSVFINCLIFFSSFSFLPNFEQQLQKNENHYLLERNLIQIIQLIEKDIKRAGFLIEKEKINLNFLHFEQNCVISIYDENNNGTIEIALETKEFFAYRLHNNIMQYKRGAENCNEEKGWENISDSNKIQLTHFKIEQNQNIFLLKLSGFFIEEKNNIVDIFWILKNDNLK